MTKTKLNITKNQYTYLYKWDVKKPRAVLNLIHGSKEHIGRYSPMIDFLNKNDISVYGIDLRGHGLSATEQSTEGHIGSYKEVVDDLALVNEIIKKEHPEIKIIMYGHSMGSFILRYFLSYYNDYDAILSGTNEQDYLSIYSGLLVAKISKVLRGKKKPNKLIDQISYKSFDKKMAKNESWMSNELQVKDEYEKDPLNHKVFTNESFVALLSWLKAIRKRKAYKNYKGKLLIVSGDKDPVGNMGKGPTKVASKYKKYGNDAKLMLFKGGHHEIHNDKNKQEVYEAILNFVKGN